MWKKTTSRDPKHCLDWKQEFCALDFCPKERGFEDSDICKLYGTSCFDQALFSVKKQLAGEEIHSSIGFSI